MKIPMLAVLLLISPTTAIAQGQDPLPRIMKQQQQLRLDIDAGMEGLTPRQARIIRKAQEEFFAATEGVQSIEQLSIQDKVRMENALETINAQVVNTSASRSDQDICWRESKTGSRTKVTRCGTKEEIEQTRRDSQSAMEKARICDASSGTSCGAIP